MARIQDTKKTLYPVPGVEGAFFRHISFKSLEEFAERSAEIQTDSPQEIIDTLLFDIGQNLACDENGDTFEDLMSMEDIAEIDLLHKVDLVRSIPQGIKIFLEGEALGNSQA